MSEWINRFRMLQGQGPGEIVHEFKCRCAPESRSHERMVSGALRNMGEDYYLEDGVPVTEAQEVPDAG